MASPIPAKYVAGTLEATFVIEHVLGKPLTQVFSYVPGSPGGDGS